MLVNQALMHITSMHVCEIKWQLKIPHCRPSSKIQKQKWHQEPKLTYLIQLNKKCRNRFMSPNSAFLNMYYVANQKHTDTTSYICNR